MRSTLRLRKLFPLAAFSLNAIESSHAVHSYIDLIFRYRCTSGAPE